jgi:hypothetical protein
MLVQIPDKDICIGSLKVSTVVGYDFPIGKCNDITAYGHVVICHFVANAGSFQRTTTLIHLIKVVTQYGRVCHLAARWETVRYGNETSTTSFMSQTVHDGLVSILQQGLSSQPFYSVVGHTVT